MVSMTQHEKLGVNISDWNLGQCSDLEVSQSIAEEFSENPPELYFANYVEFQGDPEYHPMNIRLELPIGPEGNAAQYNVDFRDVLEEFLSDSTWQDGWPSKAEVFANELDIFVQKIRARIQELT